MAKAPIRKRPSDPLQLAKPLGGLPTRQAEDQPVLEPSKEEIRRVMSALGRLGGPKGGAARAKSLSRAQRQRIAKAAAAARWRKKRL
jgi:ABC-type phosphate/phosphonate transport system ATPase subunit